MNKAERALVVGGTGPTGPHIVNGLIARGFHVTVFHRGTHESDEIPDSVEHIHGDPHFSETIEEALGSREFDLVVAMYGRTRLISRHFKDRAVRFISVGSLGATRGFREPGALSPPGFPVPARETEPTVQDETEADGKFAWSIAETERQIMALHPTATVMRYPFIYGPNQLAPMEWCLVRRALDRRPFVVLPDAGLRLITRGYSVNMAHAVLCAVDRPRESAGQVYNCADDRQLTLHELADVVASAFGHSWETLSLPAAMAMPSWPMIYTDSKGSWHRLCGTEKLRQALGYRDVLPAVEAMVRTVQWYAERREALAPDIEKRLGDPFDYATEDQMAADWQRFSQEFLARYGRQHVAQAHPYAHPRQPGQARDHLGR